MGLLKKISNAKYERKKRKQEKELEKYNQRQEELDTIYRNEKQKSDFKSLLSRLKFETYTKRLVGIIVFVCLLDLQLSYVLAFMDKIQIAESLSSQICVTVLGTVIVYLIRAYFDTKAEKRDEMIKSGLINPVSNNTIKNKAQDLINRSGMSEHIGDACDVLKTENPDDSMPCG